MFRSIGLGHVYLLTRATWYCIVSSSTRLSAVFKLVGTRLGPTGRKHLRTILWYSNRSARCWRRRRRRRRRRHRWRRC